jgi:hypothetical protein
MVKEIYLLILVTVLQIQLHQLAKDQEIREVVIEMKGADLIVGTSQHKEEIIIVNNIVSLTILI